MIHDFFPTKSVKMLRRFIGTSAAWFWINEQWLKGYVARQFVCHSVAHCWSALLNSFCPHHLSTWLHHSCALQNTIAAFWVNPCLGSETTRWGSRSVAFVSHRWAGLPHVINTSKNFKKKRIQGYRFKVRGGDGKQFPPNKGDLKNVYILSCCTVSSNVQGRKELKEERGWCAVVEMCSLSADPWGYAVQLVRRKNVAGQM